MASNPLLGILAVIAAPFVFYVVFVALLTVPFIQRKYDIYHPRP